MRTSMSTPTRVQGDSSGRHPRPLPLPLMTWQGYNAWMLCIYSKIPSTCLAERRNESGHVRVLDTQYSILSSVYKYLPAYLPRFALQFKQVFQFESTSTACRDIPKSYIIICYYKTTRRRSPSPTTSAIHFRRHSRSPSHSHSHSLSPSLLSIVVDVVTHLGPIPRRLCPASVLPLSLPFPLPLSGSCISTWQRHLGPGRHHPHCTHTKQTFDDLHTLNGLSRHTYIHTTG